MPIAARFLILTATIVAVTIACNSPQPDQPDTVKSTAITDTLPGGSIRVRNTGQPIALPWRLIEERVIQPADGSPGELTGIGGIVATADGRVAVMQTKPSVIKLFAPDGSFIRTIGHEGNGPGEFRQSALGIHGDTLLAYDAMNSRATPFLFDGTPLASWRAPCCLTGMEAVPVDESGRAWMVMMSRDGGRFERRHFDGTLVDTISATPRDAAHLWTISAAGGKGGSAMWIPLAASTTWTFARNGLFIYGNGNRYAFAIGHTGRDTVRLIEAESTTRPVTEPERDSLYREAMPKGGSMRDAFLRVAKKEDIPNQWPTWSAMTVDGANRLWVGIPGNGSEVAELDIFTPEGERLGRIPSPHPQILRGFWTADHVYLKDEDNDGRPVVHVYRLEKNEAPS